MGGFFTSLSDFFTSTNIPEQLQTVDAAGLFSNPWFMVPFLGYVGYLIYTKAISGLILLAAVMAVWMFTGSAYVADTFKGDQIQVGKIMPIILFGVAIIGVIVYALFFRSD